MKRFHLKRYALLFILFFGVQFMSVLGSNSGMTSPNPNAPVPIRLIRLSIFDQTNPIHHEPPEYVTNLLALSDHYLYLCPIGETCRTRVALLDEDGSCAYSNSITLYEDVERMTFPGNLSGEYTILYYMTYNMQEERYRGTIEL